MTTLEITSKSVLIQDLTEARYGKGSEPMSRVTFWRWCKAVGVSSGQSTYTSNETSLLHQYARSLAEKDLSKET